jgi:hypothetical protein
MHSSVVILVPECMQLQTDGVQGRDAHMLMRLIDAAGGW